MYTNHLLPVVKLSLFIIWLTCHRCLQCTSIPSHRNPWQNRSYLRVAALLVMERACWRCCWRQECEEQAGLRDMYQSSLRVLKLLVINRLDAALQEVKDGTHKWKKLLGIMTWLYHVNFRMQSRRSKIPDWNIYDNDFTHVMDSVWLTEC